MDNQKKQVADKLKEAKNVLVTVSANPSVDQLAACLGLTLMLNKLGKHAAAVFSGEVPSTIEFLKPEETLEQNTDSLRDFIIALDRSKADKLRYKVEDKVVKIFITPYRTSISQDDLEFSEGDFNVDVVVALGVKDQRDIDQAVTAHGNILHDAAVITMTTSDESALGAVHWRDPGASGVSELAASLAPDLGENALDEQIATALLTGIVARTERFSNNLTSSQTMTVSAQLMSAGANQQLVATQLEGAEPTAEPEPVVETAAVEPTEPSDQEQAAEQGAEPGTLAISHDRSETDDAKADTSDKPAEISPGDDKNSSGSTNSLSNLPPLDQPAFEPEVKADKTESEQPALVLSNSKPKSAKPAKESLSPDDTPTNQGHMETLDDIEASVHSPHRGGNADTDTPPSANPTDELPPDDALPSIHVDENGMLIHQPTGGDLRPAPGFESGAQPSGHDHQLLSQPPEDNNQASGDSPPPVPPPIV